MDLRAVHVSNTTVAPFWLRNSFSETPIYLNFGKMGTSFRVDEVKVSDTRVLGHRSCGSSKGYRQAAVVRATGKSNNNSNQDNGSSSGNGEVPIEGGDGTKGSSSIEGNHFHDTSSYKSEPVKLDWREFRAKLYINEQEENVEADPPMQRGMLPLNSKLLGTKWAHPIPVPETGCVLVATEKLERVRTFERTVILLLRSGTRHLQEGPFGIVINRPLHKMIKHMKPTNLDLATTFSDCPLHFGGPLEASTLLLKTGKESKLPGFEEVIPGLCYGALSSLDAAAGLVRKGVVKPQDFSFFVGYAGWELDQLREEIESDYWYVAACSSNLLSGGTSDSSEGLWEEILQLMGGHYSELSRKPKQDL